MKLFFALLLSVLALSPARAQDSIQVTDPQNHLKGRDLLNFCKGQYDIDYGYCAGYVTAISEIMLDHAVYGQTACNQGPVASQQLMELVQEHMESDPAAQMQPASVAAAQALSRSFNCRY